MLSSTISFQIQRERKLRTIKLGSETQEGKIDNWINPKTEIHTLIQQNKYVVQMIELRVIIFKAITILVIFELEPRDLKSHKHPYNLVIYMVMEHLKINIKIKDSRNLTTGGIEKKKGTE